MRHEIIYIDGYSLIVSDEKIEKYDYVFNPIYKTLYQWIENADIHFDRIDAKKVIAHRPLTDAPILEGVALLPEFEDDDFLNTEIQVVGDNKTMSVSTFLKKYGKETYKYTEEDLIKAIELAQTPSDYDSFPFIDEVMQSFQQPKRPKYFECEMEKGYMLNDDGEPYGFPVHETGKPKTIANSQGQTELVGEYIYE
jgi:hypothetical protein